MALKAERPTDIVYLWTNEDRAELDRLAKDIQQAQAAAQSPRRVGDSTGVQDAAAAYDEYMEGARERATQVHIRAVQRKAWRQLLAAHPPREDVVGPDTTDDDDEVIPGEVVESFPMDAIRGFNVDTMAEDLVPESIELWQFDAGDDAERAQERADFLDDLTDGAFSQLYSAAVRLNTDQGPDPKWSASSWAARMSAETSRSDSPSD